jgi:hypothetical protein
MATVKCQRLMKIFSLKKGSTMCECAKGAKAVGAVTDDSTAGGGDTASR